jgi:Matrixin
MTSTTRHRFIHIAVSLSLVATIGVVPRAAAQGVPTACNRDNSTPTFDTQGDGQWQSQIDGQIKYNIIRSSMPDTLPGSNTPYNKERMKRRIISGARTWNRGRDRCGIDRAPNLKFAFHEDGGSDAANWEDGVNTVDFRFTVNGSLLAGHCPSPEEGFLLGCEHTRHDGGVIFETDIGFNKSKDWWTGIRPVPAGRDAYDLWSVAAHEFGHSLDVAHSSDSDNATAYRQAQVMYHQFDEREERRRLGLFDLLSACRAQGCD